MASLSLGCFTNIYERHGHANGNSYAVLAKLEPKERSREDSNCVVCEKRNEKRNNLKIHINDLHEMPPTEMKSANVQTPSEFLENQGDSVFVPYRCFYCGKMLSDLRDLEKHKYSCQGPTNENSNSIHKVEAFCNETSEPSEPGHFVLNSDELLSLKNLLIGAYTSERIPCSICSQDFESESFLQLHILQAHIEPMKS